MTPRQVTTGTLIAALTVILCVALIGTPPTKGEKPGLSGAATIQPAAAANNERPRTRASATDLPRASLTTSKADEGTTRERDESTIIVKGTVAHVSGKPLANEPVSLLCSAMDFALEATTGAKGEFSLELDREGLGEGFQVDLAALERACWTCAPSFEHDWFDDCKVWPAIRSPAITENEVDFALIELQGALVTWRLDAQTEDAQAEVFARCGEISIKRDVKPGSGERVTWLLPGFYAWEAELVGFALEVPIVVGQFVVADGETRSVDIKPATTRPVQIQVVGHREGGVEGKLTVWAEPLMYAHASFDWRDGTTLTVGLPCDASFAVYARCSKGACGTARAGPNDRTVTVVLDGPPAGSRDVEESCGFVVRGTVDAMDLEDSFLPFDVCLVSDSGDVHRGSCQEAKWDDCRFEAIYKLPRPGAWKLMVCADARLGYPNGLAIAPVPFTVQAGEYAELDVGQLPEAPWGRLCQRFHLQMRCGASEVKSAALPATFPGAFVQHRWPLFRGISEDLIPSAVISGGASVPVKQVAPDETATAYARVDFPTRVRVSSEQSGLSDLHASLLRSPDGTIREGAEYMYVSFTDGVAELWLGPGLAILKVSNGDVVLHSETVCVPVSGCLELAVQLSQGRARFEFGEMMREISADAGGPCWQVEIWRTDRWEDAFTVEEPCVIATLPGRYRAYIDDPCIRAEAVFYVEAGGEVTVPLDAQLFAATHVDIERPPDGLRTLQYMNLRARAEDQLYNDLGWDGDPLTTTWAEGAFRLHGLPRGRACWVWGNADDWFLKPIRVTPGGSGQVMSAAWLRLSPVAEEWRLIDGATYIQIPGTPVVQSQYLGLPQGEVRVIYQAMDGRRLNFDVQIEEGQPAPMPDGLRQALQENGRLLDKPPPPPPEEAPSY